MRVHVITVSDRIASGACEDLSGREIEKVLKEALPEIETGRSSVPDDADRILSELERNSDADWIVTTGGTGSSPRDLAPEATARFIDREFPGIQEVLRAESWKETPYAVYSRGIAGQRGGCFVVNLPGALKAARSGASIMARFMKHGTAMAECRRDE